MIGKAVKEIGVVREAEIKDTIFFINTSEGVEEGFAPTNGRKSAVNRRVSEASARPAASYRRSERRAASPAGHDYS